MARERVANEMILPRRGTNAIDKVPYNWRPRTRFVRKDFQSASELDSNIFLKSVQILQVRVAFLFPNVDQFHKIIMKSTAFVPSVRKLSNPKVHCTKICRNGIVSCSKAALLKFPRFFSLNTRESPSHRDFCFCN